MTFPRMKAFRDDLAAIPQIARGQVWCTVCGRMERVDGVGAMFHGWPKCCGYTMTIDSPAERATRKGGPDAA